jgi:glutamate-1-semialdehyde aminotransferase
MNKVKSDKFLKKAKKLIPGLTQTFSKAPYSYVEGVYPTYVERGLGSHLFDVDGNEYIDYVLALGPVMLGYRYPSVDNAIKKQLKNGISFSIPHRLEVEVSEQISKMVPSAEMVKFTKTGSDAGTAAVRLARAITKRDKIAYSGTGGVWHDWFTSITSRNEGIPKSISKMTIKFVYNDIESLKKIFEKEGDTIAAVYIEPITLEFPKNNFLKQVKKLTRKFGSLLIFDEVVTGFRYAKGGAEEYLKIEPDVSAWGKGIANGMPLGAITGKSKFMEKFNDVFYSTSYGGETLSLAAASAVLDEINTKPVIKHLWKFGKNFADSFNQISSELQLDIKIEGTPIRSVINCRDDKKNLSLSIKSLFYQECIRRGILFGPGVCFFSYSHTTKDIKKTLTACEKSMKIVKKAIDTNTIEKQLKGKPMKPIISF